MCVHEGHVYCLWPLPHVVLVCTTKVSDNFTTSDTTVLKLTYSLCIVTSARNYKQLNRFFLVCVAPSTKATQCWLA